MLDYLLKSSGCLLILYLFYVFFLEKENMHMYKRVYLLSSVVVSFAIPFITFINYVTVVEQVQPIINTAIIAEFPVIHETEQINYWPILLWSVYGIGVFLFGIKFIKNSYDIIQKIIDNPKRKSGRVVSVLLEEDIVPHTFMKYIFFNKDKYVTRQIPEEVILHEETHARQKHSLDVLLLEFLQVLFWFNPILFLLNKSIKLNHEFLADKAVLNTGIDTKTYQQTLLAYSSNASQFQLAHAINYSSIKKRLTVMKKHRSKKKIWMRSVILLPVLALLLFSFSTTVQQKNATPKQIAEYNSLAKRYNNQPANQRVIKLAEINRLKTLYDLMNSKQKAKAEKFPNIPPPPPPSKQRNLARITAQFYEYKNKKGEDVKVELQYDGHKDIYETPPPPPLPENATEEQRKAYIKVTEEYRKKIVEEKKILDKYVAIIKDENGKDINPVFRIDDNNENSEKTMLSDSEKRLNLVNNMSTFYLNNKVISKHKAISIVEKNNEMNIYSKNGVVHLSTEPIGSKGKERPITFVNGKGQCDGCVLELTKEKFSGIVLSVDKGDIISFKIKFPKKPTVTVTNSNILNDEAKAFLKESQVGQMVQIFGLKSSAFKNRSAPIIFKIMK